MRLIENQFKNMPSPRDDRDKLAKGILMDYVVTDDYFSVLTKSQIKIYNQKSTPMCTAFSIIQNIRLNEYKENNVFRDFSYAYSYGNRKDNEYQGEGYYLRSAIKHLQKEGICELRFFDKMDTYDKIHSDFLRLTEFTHNNARRYKIKSYFKVNFEDEEEVKKVFKQFGNVLLASIPLYDSIEKNVKGVIPFPNVKKEKLYGSHAVALIGHKVINGQLHYIIANSWGTNCGNKGIFYLPSNYPINEIWLLIDQKKIEIKLTDGENRAKVNGRFEKLEEKIFIENNRMYASSEFMAEKLGYELSWNPTRKEIKISEYVSNIYMHIGSKRIYNIYDLNQIKMDVEPILRNGITFIPIRFLSEMLDLNITWDKYTRTATVSNY